MAYFIRSIGPRMGLRAWKHLAEKFWRYLKR